MDGGCLMSYSVNTSGKPVMLNVLANADASIVGLEIGSSRIVSMSENELCQIDLMSHGAMLEYHRSQTLFKYRASKEPLIVMETIGENGVPAGHREILDMLKLYKSADIFSCYTTFYKFKQNKLTHGGLGEVLLREHPTHWPDKPYTMTEEERLQFEPWWKSHKDIFDTCNNSKFKQIVRMYLDSFMMEDAETAFVVLSVVLEMLFGSPNNELTYRISRGAALFLSADRGEMRTIFSQVKRLYTLRSKYVHEGTKIEWEKLFELREIVRKIIIDMYERQMNKSCFSFQKFAEELSFDGYVKEAVSLALPSDHDVGQ